MSLSYWIATLWIIAFNQFQILAARGASFLWIGEPLIVAQIVAFYREVASSTISPYRGRHRRMLLPSATLVLDLNKKEVVDDYQTVFEQAMLVTHQDENQDENLSLCRPVDVGQFLSKGTVTAGSGEVPEGSISAGGAAKHPSGAKQAAEKVPFLSGRLSPSG